MIFFHQSSWIDHKKSAGFISFFEKYLFFCILNVRLWFYLWGDAHWWRYRTKRRAPRVLPDSLFGQSHRHTQSHQDFSRIYYHSWGRICDSLFTYKPMKSSFPLLFNAKKYIHPFPLKIADSLRFKTQNIYTKGIITICLDPTSQMNSDLKTHFSQAAQTLTKLFN